MARQAQAQANLRFRSALVLIGAYVDGSGINASDTLKNENFTPHVALKPLLEWLQKNGPDQTIRNAASRAVTIFTTWQASQARSPNRLRYSMTMGSTGNETTARLGLAGARHQLGMDEEARNQICVASEVWSLRQFCAPKGNGPTTCQAMEAERWWSPGWMAASICWRQRMPKRGWPTPSSLPCCRFRTNGEAMARWCSGCPVATTASGRMPPPMR